MPEEPLDDERGVREAYAFYSDELYGLALRSLGVAGLAAEAVEKTFLRAWRAGKLSEPEGDVHLRGWLFAILREVMIDLGRDRAARPGVAEAGLEAAIDRLQRALLAWQVEEAMRRIDQQHRQVLVETYYRGRPWAEVATDLGVPVEVVKSRVYNGLRALKAALKQVALED